LELASLVGAMPDNSWGAHHRLHLYFLESIEDYISKCLLAKPVVVARSVMYPVNDIASIAACDKAHDWGQQGATAPTLAAVLWLEFLSLWATRRTAGSGSTSSELGH